MSGAENSEYWNNLAEELDQMQKDKNSGRGVEVIRSIIFYLRKGQIDVARIVCRSESDKFDNIRDIQAVIVEKLFKNKNHPWPLTWKHRK